MRMAQSGLSCYDDVVTHELGVGDDDGFVVQGHEGGGEDLNFFCYSLLAAALDVVAYVEGAEDNHQENCRKIGQAALEGQADGQAGGT